MRDKLIAIGCIFLLILAIGCKEEPTATTLRIELNKGTRTIAPNDSSMEITGYKIIPTGPDGKVGSTRYTYYSYCNLENIKPGKWTIEAYGFNSDRIDVAYGKAEIAVTEGNNTITIPVSTLVGKGSLSIVFTWDKEAIDNPNLKLFLKSQDDKSAERELAASITASEGKANLEMQDLDAGSYSLRGELYDGDTKKSGFIEAIRITNQKTTKGTIPFESGKLEDEKQNSSTIDISNNTSSPIEIKIEGVEKIVAKGTSFTATLSILSNKISSSDISASWYLNGTAIGSGLSCKIKPTEFGDYRIDVIVSTKNKGSTGSAYETFSSVATTRKGMPYNMKVVKNSEISLGSNNVIRFLPNGNAILASNDLKVLEILSIENNKVEKVKTYSFDELSIDGIVSDIATAALPANTNFTLYVITNNNPEIVALSYTKAGNALSFKAKQTNIVDEKGKKIENLGPAIGISNTSYLNAVIVGASTLNFKNTGVLFIKSNPSSNDNNFIEAMDLYEDSFGEGPINSLDYSESSEAVTAVSGTTGAVYALKRASDNSIMFNPAPVSDSSEKLDQGNHESFTRGIMGRILSHKTGIGYILTHNSLNLYEMDRSKIPFICLQNNKSFKFTSHLNKIPALKGSYDNLFYYMIDNLCKKLYVLTFENGEFLCDKEEDFVILPSNEYTRIEISRDGKNIILYDPKCETKDIVVLSVTR